jgi:hypothetical protein
MGASREETNGVHDLIVCTAGVENGVGSESDEGRLMMITISTFFVLGLIC